MSDSEEEQVNQVNLTAKTPTQSYAVKVKENATISQVKDKLLEMIPSATKDQLCIIYTGKILKDVDTLTLHKIGDGHTIHLVVRGGQRQSPPTNTSSAQTSTPAATGADANARPPGAAEGGFPQGFPQIGDMMNNPEMMRQVLDNPLMQNMMNNPELMRSILTSNPQFQRLVESNPEVGHLLNDPNIIRQTMEMIRNPNMFQEMMRNHDIAIRNLQGIPGGEAALERLYQDVQEPLLNSATNSLGGNPFASLRNQDGSETRSQRAGVENREALPNPWGSSASNTPRRAAATGDTAPPNPAAAMLNAPGMNSLMQQMMADPNVRSTLFSPQMVDTLRQSMQSNPQLFDSILSASPAGQSNPQLLQQLRSQMPQMLELLGNPEVMQAMTNPRVAEAVQQVQAGFETLRREAPQLLSMFNPLATMNAGGTAQNPTLNTTAPARAPQANAQMDQLAQLLAGLNPSGNVPPQQQVNMEDNLELANPEQMYAEQLEQLSSMGFNNRGANIAALTSSFGDLNEAVERLLNAPR